MPLLLIKGTFRPGTGVPDGDTVRFAPDDPDLLFRLARQGRPPRLNNGTVPLRYEGIDAMERGARQRSEEHTSELQSRQYLVCRLLLEKKKTKQTITITTNIVTDST